MSTFIVNKGEDNIVCPTLVEKSLLDAGDRAYIWEVQNDQSLAPVYFTCVEESTELQRYNQFTITEKANPDQMNGEVELLPGQHSYKIYEIDNTVLPNIVNLAIIDYTTLTLVEQGIIKVPDSIENTEYPDLSLTNTVYPNVGN